MGDTKREPFKKRLHAKPLGSKSLSRPLFKKKKKEKKGKK
jgi:hypothetical protein